jgi:hypothetical protein
MPIKEVVLSFLYMLPVLILLDKNNLKTSLFLFIFLMTPVFLSIQINIFEFLVLVQLIFWIIYIIFVKHFEIFRK